MRYCQLRGLGIMRVLNILKSEFESSKHTSILNYLIANKIIVNLSFPIEKYMISSLYPALAELVHSNYSMNNMVFQLYCS